MTLGSYPQVYNLGHKAIEELLLDPVIVQEKVDGSQFSFGKIDGVLCFRSKGAELFAGAKDKLFSAAIEAVEAAEQAEGLLTGNVVYRGEVVSKPKHNILKYERLPSGYVAVFDVLYGEESYFPPYIVVQEAERLGFGAVPLLYEGMVTGLDQLTALLGRESFLGGTKIEGVVIKNYARFTRDKKAMMGKLVSEAFKETRIDEWKAGNPTRVDVVEALVKGLRTNARWEKAVQHLRDGGRLTGTPQDIGLLLREVPGDILKEEIDQIKEVLFERFWQDIARGSVKGLAEWYKNRLAEGS